MIQIDQEHLEYKRQVSTWRVYRDLYAGGHQFKLHAADYLLPRQKEPLDVYGERLQRVFYENYIGSIVDWYASTLFRREPSVSFRRRPRIWSSFSAHAGGRLRFEGATGSRVFCGAV